MESMLSGSLCEDLDLIHETWNEDPHYHFNSHEEEKSGEFLWVRPSQAVV